MQTLVCQVGGGDSDGGKLFCYGKRKRIGCSFGRLALS